MDRALWPLGAWDQRFERPPLKGKGRGKDDSGLLNEAIVTDDALYRLTEDDCYLACAHPPPATASVRRRELLTMLPPGRYLQFDPDRSQVAVGHWDANNGIFRCALTCELCGNWACNRRMWWRLDTHASHRCDRCKRSSPGEERGGR